MFFLFLKQEETSGLFHPVSQHLSSSTYSLPAKIKSTDKFLDLSNLIHVSEALFNDEVSEPRYIILYEYPHMKSFLLNFVPLHYS